MFDLRTSKITKILLSVGVILGLGVVLFAQILQYRSQDIKIEEIKAGNLQKGSITYDKLAEDVFTTVELAFDSGATSTAKILEGSIEDGVLGGELLLETSDGQIVAGEVIGTIYADI